MQISISVHNQLGTHVKQSRNLRQTWIYLSPTQEANDFDEFIIHVHLKYYQSSCKKTTKTPHKTTVARGRLNGHWRYLGILLN